MTSLALPAPGRLQAVWLLVGALHLAGAALVVAAGGDALAGAAIVAYGLGLRHGVDPDHLCAIDNAARRRLASGRDARGVGLLFSTGHGAVVVTAVVVASALGAGAAFAESSAARIAAVGGGALLVALGVANVPVLHAALRAEERARVSLFGRRISAATHPAAVFALGALFGLGLDSAAAVLLLVGSGASTAALLGLPLLFVAGMALVDTADGELVRRLYGWSVADPRRRLRANAALTGASILLALVIGGYEVVRSLG